MKYLKIYFLLIFTVLPMFGCQNTNNSNKLLDNKSYINNFELLQENPSNDTLVRINSPKAIINPTNNDLEIFDSTIDILNQEGHDIKVKSGYSSLNSLSNVISVYDNVNISFADNKDYFLITNSFKWDLNNSEIELDSPVNINFDSTKINATNGSYNINSSLLMINNNLFNRSIYNSDGVKQYQIIIISDLGKWLNEENILVFTSNDKQVETTINFLSIE